MSETFTHDAMRSLPVSDGSAAGTVRADAPLSCHQRDMFDASGHRAYPINI